MPGMGALSGLTGYMTLGLGAKAKPCVATINESEVLITKDGRFAILDLQKENSTHPVSADQGFVVEADSKVSKSAAITWPGPPEEIGDWSLHPRTD